MIFPSNRVGIVIATKPEDFRKGLDGLAAVLKGVLRKDPFTGTVFVVRTKRADRLKPIDWDGTGLVTIYKGLERQSSVWPAIRDGDGGDRGIELGVGLRVGRSLAHVLGGEREPPQRDLTDERFGPGGDVVHAILHGGLQRRGGDGLPGRLPRLPRREFAPAPDGA